MLVVFGIAVIVIGLFFLFVSAVEDNGTTFILGLMLVFGGMLGFGAGNYDLGKDQLINKTAPTIEECQKELPRDQNCVMVAIPEKYLDKE
ncbi:MAG: hypothetical protein GOVbin4162_65 [Prokaryotic dsDNA virus sp.]|nr:MAG: hypothetical protein GOVbin4162_65 [Prokaryotic dsDNA virus sp.]|tara:strand:+ start:3013 stop:3282 length:270 start_codon:yes stop_codon:yes gene_type:complete